MSDIDQQKYCFQLFRAVQIAFNQSRRRSPDREKGAIDHCFIYNAQEGVAVKVFDCITARFTVKLTDHYPYLIDAAL